MQSVFIFPVHFAQLATDAVAVDGTRKILLRYGDGDTGRDPPVRGRRFPCDAQRGSGQGTPLLQQVVDGLAARQPLSFAEGGPRKGFHDWRRYLFAFLMYCSRAIVIEGAAGTGAW